MAGEGDALSVWQSVSENISAALNLSDIGLKEEAERALEEAFAQAGGQIAAISRAGAKARGEEVEEPTAWNPEAEHHVLAAILNGSGPEGNSAVLAVRPALGEDGDAFYSTQNRLVYRAALQADSNGGCDPITVADYLERQGLLEQAGGRERISELAALQPEDTNVQFWARIVRRLQLERRLSITVRVVPRDPDAIGEAARALAREEIGAGAARAVDGADWLASQPAGVPSVWGSGSTVLWAEGEPLMLYGPDGVGKTSIAQQLVLHLCGLRLETFLDLPVARADKPVLYLACDRPQQARRSMYRMLTPEQREQLRDRLAVWGGPLPFVIPEKPQALYDFCLLHKARFLVIDSLKDVAHDLVDSVSALRVNQAFQWLNANGVDLLVLHHPRKQPAGQPARARSLEDVYGDRNLVSGMGSVLSIWGKGGDPIVEVEHLKQPANEFGPVKVVHDHDAGRTVLYEHREVTEILAGRALSTSELATYLYGSPEPSKNEVEKARRTVRKYVERGEVLEHRTPEATIYRLVT